MELHSRTIRRLREPDVEILGLSGLEEEDIVAIVQIGELVQLVEVGFRVEFGVFAGVRKERVEVVQQVAVAIALVSIDERDAIVCRIPICYASGCENENPLAVLWLRLAIFSCASDAVRLGLCHRLVYCRHRECATGVLGGIELKMPCNTFFANSLSAKKRPSSFHFGRVTKYGSAIHTCGTYPPPQTARDGDDKEERVVVI